jgi:hypothetical protein
VLGHAHHVCNIPQQACKPAAAQHHKALLIILFTSITQQPTFIHPYLYNIHIPQLLSVTPEVWAGAPSCVHGTQPICQRRPPAAAVGHCPSVIISPSYPSVHHQYKCGHNTTRHQQPPGCLLALTHTDQVWVKGLFVLACDPVGNNGGSSSSSSTCSSQHTHTMQTRQPISASGEQDAHAHLNASQSLSTWRTRMRVRVNVDGDIIKFPFPSLLLVGNTGNHSNSHMQRAQGCRRNARICDTSTSEAYPKQVKAWKQAHQSRVWPATN